MRLFQKFLIKRPISTSALFLSFVILGLISLTKLEIRLLPALDLPSITVVTGMPGYAADEVESLVSKPIIETLSSVPGIKNIYSETIEGLSLIRIQLNWGQKPEIVSLDLRERLDKLRSFLPENSLRSIISRLSSNDRPVLELIIVPNQEFKELRYLIESNWKPGLERIDGVALVDIKGGHKKEIQIKIDPRLMSSYGLNPEDIQESILKENQSVPAGYLEQGERSILVRTGSSFTKIDDLENVLISRRNEERGVSLKEFSAITDSYKKNDLAILYSKKNVISLSIYKEAESNTIETVTHVLDYINSLKQKNNEYKIIYLYNEAEEIQNSFINLSLELGIGSCLAFISLLFFLKNIRASFLLISMIPLSIFSTFFFMKVFGLSLNVMSLGGLSLGIGMLIDSGNVVLNSMETFKKEGKSYLQSAFLGTEAVNSSVISAVSSTLIVFIPILFLDGITGIVFKETAITVSISLTFSLFIALSLLPALYGILKEKDLEVQIQRNPKYEIIYLRIYEYFYQHKTLFFIGNLLILFISFLLLFRIPLSLLPESSSGRIIIEVSNFKGKSLESSINLSLKISKELEKIEGLKHIVAFVGKEESLISNIRGEVNRGPENIQFLILPENNMNLLNKIKEIKEKLKFFPEIAVKVKKEVDTFSRLLSSDDKRICLELYGENRNRLIEYSNTLHIALLELQSIENIEIPSLEKKEEHHIIFDLEKMSSYGLSADKLASFFKTGVEGILAGKMKQEEESRDIRLIINNHNLEDLLSRSIINTEGKLIPISGFTKIQNSDSFKSLERKGNRPLLKIFIEIHKSSLDELKSLIKNFPLENTYSLKISGEKESMDESFQELSIALILSCIFILFLLSSQFESLRLGILLFSLIPFVLPGIVFALLMSGKSLNISSFTGIILLLGIVVDNSVLFYEYYSHELKASNTTHAEGARKAGINILRPILMNYSSTIAALLPLALELGKGTEFQSPLAITVIGGLFACGSLSLLFLPLLFSSKRIQ